MASLRARVFADELRVHQLDHEARGGAALEHVASLLPDALERVEPFALDLRRNHLDGDARQMFAERLAHRLLAGVLGDRLFVVLRCGLGLIGRVGRAAQGELQNVQRQLRIVLRQPLRLLPQETPLELLVLFLQQKHELSVLVALLLEPRVGERQIRGVLLERLHLLQLVHRHDEHECKNAIDLSSDARGRNRFFYAARAARTTPASSRASAAPSIEIEREPADAAGNSNTARFNRL